jgi:hypothetical protein
MRRDFVSVILWLVVLAGCPGGGSGIGGSCGGIDDCAGDLQCLNSRCMPRCDRAPDCGDGYRCDQDRLCVAATGQKGDNCKSEVDCEVGLSCQINGAELDSEGRLLASCGDENVLGKPSGASCGDDVDCRNGVCELGHCVDLCLTTADCPSEQSCMTVPRVAASGELFHGCLPAHGPITWSIPVTMPSSQILLPVPTGAASAELVMTVDDPGQKVGVESVLDPCGCTRYTVPCPFPPHSDPGSCTDLVAADEFYSHAPEGSSAAEVDASSSICGTPTTCNPDGAPAVNHLRHLPDFGRSVLLMPSIPSPGELKPGAYQIQVSSFWPDDSHGLAIPRVTAVVQIEDMSALKTLDLHFFFLDLADHPCSALPGNASLDAATAQQAMMPFQNPYLRVLHDVFAHAGIAVNAASYENVDRHALDGLDLADAGSLFSFGHYARGINVFFVRSLSPIGTEVFGPNPGPAGMPQSGIVVALDTLCYRDWDAVARLTAHALARYMGLYHNVEPRDPVQGAGDPPWQDLIIDTDMSITNLLYYASEPGGATLSPGQIDALRRSAVLR